MLFKQLGWRFYLLLAFALSLLACSPRLDWRMVQAPQEAYVAFFPGKPDKLERKITFQDQELSQTLEVVKIDDDIYSIAAIHLSKQQIQLAPALLEFLESNIFKSAGVDRLTANSAEAAYQTSSHQRFSIKDYFLEMKSAGVAQKAMRVRWLTRPDADGSLWIYQVSVLHSGKLQGDVKSFFSAEDRAYFFDEFHPD